MSMLTRGEAIRRVGGKYRPEILSILFSKWEGKKAGRACEPIGFNQLLKILAQYGSRPSPPTISKAMKELCENGFADGIENGYILSDLGVYLWSLVKAIEDASKIKRSLVPFSDKVEPRAWVSETEGMITKTKNNGELLITTRWFSSFDDADIRTDLVSAFQRARKREVNIKVVAARGIAKPVVDLFRNDFKAEMRFVPRKLLEKPPKILKPIFLEDFAHVMIVDRTHWLYIMPHKKEEKHTGRRSQNDPVVGNLLADIFDCFWEMSEESVT
jgi:hypothetical protein